MKAFFLNLCPNCYGTISDSRLSEGGVCSNCLRYEVKGTENIYEALKKNGNLKHYEEIYRIKKFEEEFSKFFSRKVGKPFSVQLTWARRIFLGKSFSIIAPTGIGKTTFGIISSLFFDGKFYFIVPTSILVEEVYKKLNSLNEGKKIVMYSSRMKKKERDDSLRKIKKGEFDILITTHMFLYKHHEEIPKVDYIFVDDVDSFLKQARNVDKALKLIGFKERAIDIAMKIINLKQKKKFDAAQRLEKFLEKYKKNHGIMVVSSATAKPKSKRIHLFRELLDFDVGVSTSTVRNILDVYVRNISLIEILKRYGSGALIFVSSDKGKEYVSKVVNELKGKGFRAESYENLSEETIKKFRKGEIDFLVGISSYRNPLARGIDIPERIRYVVFYGVPKFRFNLFKNLTPMKAIVFLSNAYDFVDDKKEIERALKFLKKRFLLSDRIKNLINSLAKDKNLIERMNESENVSIENGEFIVADVTGYVQSSGRCSRVYFGGLSKGVAITIVDDEKALTRLKKKLYWDYGIKILEYDETLVNKAFEKVDEDRRKIKLAIEGKYKGRKDIVKTALMIVESPNKARTIANFFGKPLRRFFGRLVSYEVNVGNFILNVIATQGHVFDLVTKKGYYGCLINDKIIPVYGTIKYYKDKSFVDEYEKFDFDKMEIVKTLRELASEVDVVFVATDPDVEGEKIAWDISNSLAPYAKKICRIEFHEVTKSAIIKAIKKFRNIDELMVNSQIVRRVVDRWVGFELSKKVQRRFKRMGLSAGRVQTPLLGFVINRYMKSKVKVWELIVFVGERRVKFKFERKYDFPPEIVYVGDEKVIENPEPPFNTHEMLEEASRYGFSARKVMDLAQDLFEAGLITYHRTDSHRVSNEGMRIAEEYIREKFGEKYLHMRRWGKGGAHECIRPTKVLDPSDLIKRISLGDYDLSRDHVKLYSLIFKRFIASQMSSVLSLKRKYKVRFLGKEEELSVRKGVIEDGFNLLIPLGVSEEEKVKYYWKRVPLEYPLTQGEMIRLMKERGLGRPSTYAKIVNTLFERKYVKQVGNFVIPTKLGMLVFKYLNEKFGNFVSVEFTAKVEEMMNEVERGYDYQKILRYVLNQIERFFNLNERDYL